MLECCYRCVLHVGTDVKRRVHQGEPSDLSAAVLHNRCLEFITIFPPKVFSGFSGLARMMSCAARHCPPWFCVVLQYLLFD